MSNIPTDKGVYIEIPVDPETKAQLDQGATTHNTTISHLLETMVHLLLTDEVVEQLILKKISEKEGDDE